MSSLLASVGLEILLILVLIVANGVFSGSEIAIVSARRVRLEQMSNQGNRRAAVALRLATCPNDLLSTVQIGITLIGILLYGLVLGLERMLVVKDARIDG